MLSIINKEKAILKKKASSYIELSQEALSYNLNSIKRIIDDNVRFCSVVKGNAYGHGLVEYVGMAIDLGVEQFAVFSIEEAMNLYENYPDIEIMLMGWVSDEDLPWLIRHGISFYVFDQARLSTVVKISKEMGVPARVHLEFETGMHRTGIRYDRAKETLQKLKELPQSITLEGVCTHFAGAESFVNHFRIREQIVKFEELRKLCDELEYRPRYFHAACSAAALNYPETQYDMVRIGILQYGYWPTEETQVRYFDKHNITEDPLRRIISWKSKVMTINKVPAGAMSGYGTSFMAEKDTIVAIVPIGYANGYARVLSNKGRVLVNGQRMSVVGVVNMNMMMVDVTNVDKIKIGDEVVLIGWQKGLSITVASFGELSNQLNYELLTRLPKDILRFIEEG